MNKRNEKFQLRISILIALLIAVLVLTAATFTFREFNKTQELEANQYLIEITNKYAQSLNSKISSDFQILHSVASYMEEDPAQETSSIINTLQLVNAQNDFIYMGFVLPDGEGYYVESTDTEIISKDMSDVAEVQKAFDGQSILGIGAKDLLPDDKYLYYAVPIYRGNTICGALIGVSSVDIFLNILEDPLFHGNGYVHMINKNGKFIIRSQHALVEEPINSIFGNKEISEGVRIETQRDMAVGKDVFTSFPYKGEDSWISIVKLNINDWFIFSVVPQKSLSKTFRSMTTSAIFFLGLIGLSFIILFYYISYIFRRNRAYILKLAYYDPLTGIFNKNKFTEEIREQLHAREEFALVGLDIANFKFINESLGYETGDRFLKHIAKILADAANEKEYYYRESGDNFGLLLRYKGKEQLEKRLEAILHKIIDFSISEGIQYTIVCNCGVIIIDWETNQVDIDTLLDRVSLALKAAKGHHKSTIVYFDESLLCKEHLRAAIENQMNPALKNHEFFIMLQPKFNLNTGKLHSAEALVRWRTSEGKLIYPDEFIPIFEQNGFVASLDLYVLEEVCKNLREWTDKGYRVTPVSVNQSRVLFFQSNYLEKLEEVILRYKIDPSLLILEITEGISIGNIEEIEEKIQLIHGMGISVSMDDFGSGYSSLNILKELSIDELKLDKVFLPDDKTKFKGETILASIIKLASDLSISTVAEGIETAEQAIFLRNTGCDIGQGYYFSKPVDVEDFLKLII